MISRENCKAVRIHILTFKENLPTDIKMNEERRRKTDFNKFICSVCLNTNRLTKNIEHDKPIPKRCEFCLEQIKTHIKCKDRIESVAKEKPNKNVSKTKTIAVQTQDTDVNKDINLLNEVLTVFQNKKQTKPKSNTIILKDASMSTEEIRSNLKPKLQVSRIFQFSTNEALIDKNDKTTIIANHEDFIRSQRVIDLKYKSSSIPQMKSEELKHLHEKTKSKDAVEEVNRMFGNVKRRANVSESNRPVVRNGPRILPVVKKEKTESIDRIWSPCRCQSDLSSGDSFVKPQYCHHNERKENGGCDKCVYMMCCMKNCHKIPPGVYCQCCRGENFRCNRNRPDFDCND